MISSTADKGSCCPDMTDVAEGCEGGPESSSWCWRLECEFDEKSGPPAAGTPMIKEGHRWSPPVLGGEWAQSRQSQEGKLGCSSGGWKFGRVRRRGGRQRRVVGGLGPVTQRSMAARTTRNLTRKMTEVLMGC